MRRCSHRSKEEKLSYAFFSYCMGPLFRSLGNLCYCAFCPSIGRSGAMVSYMYFLFLCTPISATCTITLLVLQMTPLMQIEKIALDHHIPIIISTQKKYSK
jgi:hypothetical protein